MPSVRVAELALDPVPRSVASARVFFRRILDEFDFADEMAELAVLALSEVVTNAVVHANTSFVVRVLPGPDRLRVEVEDLDSIFPTSGQVDPAEVGGLGLAILTAVAGNWGVAPLADRPGKSVWFTIPLEDHRERHGSKIAAYRHYD